MLTSNSYIQDMVTSNTDDHDSASTHTEHSPYIWMKLKTQNNTARHTYAGFSQQDYKRQRATMINDNEP
eukprot:m.702 g.702  ORF g.702 m.702 type:complete len:69 (+) comp656_c0_seq1:100-306(+)